VFIGPDTHSAAPPLALSNLELYDITMFDSDLHALLARCPNIHSLGLSCLTDVTEAGLISLVMQLPLLHALSLGHSEGGIITDLVLGSIARRGAEIRKVSLHCLSDVTDDGLYALARSCPLLQDFDIEGMETTDVFLLVLTWCCGSLCGNLLRARFSKCSISSAGVKALMFGCPRLTHLSVLECDRVDKAVMGEVAAKYLPYRVCTNP
jgi:hypothetical protein